MLLFGVILVIFFQVSCATYASVDDLISNMDLTAKIGQMVQIDIAYFLEPNSATVNSTKLKNFIETYQLGSILNSPFSGGPVNGVTGWTASDWRNVMVEIQEYVQKYTKYNIPVIYGIDSIHGATYVKDATLFPQAINLGATFNPSLAESAGQITSKDTRAAGITWIFAPVLGLGLQPLWARFSETFGEDPYLAAQMGKSMITGLQNSLSYSPDVIPRQTAACMKHFIAYSIPQDGHDRSPVQLPDRVLRQLYLPSFQAAVDAGVLTAMESYQEVGGIPMVSSQTYLTDLIRKQMKFEGFMVTDYAEIQNLYSWHKVSPTVKEAVQLSMEDTTIDMSMVPADTSFSDYLTELVQSGVINETRIDASVKRILTVKSRLGMLDQDFVLPIGEDSLTASVGQDSDWQASLQAARESVTLVKNDNKLLPLSTNAKVLVTGPTANSSISQTGGWSIHWQGVFFEGEFSRRATVLTGLQGILPGNGGQVSYTPGVGLDATSLTGVDMDAVIAMATGMDAIIICLGEGTYEEKPGDIDDLALPAGQVDYVTSLASALPTIPIITIMIGGRPRLFPDAVAVSKSVLLAYQPGPVGGQAVAEVLTGQVIPSGRLPFTYPRYSANPIYPYHHKYNDQCVVHTGEHSADYVQCAPQWAFGTGLSYTTFEYSNLVLSGTTISEHDNLTVSVDVQNTGTYEAQHSVLLFVYDLYRRVTPEYKLLKRFDKLTLAAGQKQTVTWTLNAKDWEYVGLESHYVMEDGDYRIGVGASVDCRSEDITTDWYLHTADTTSTTAMCADFQLQLTDNYYPVCDEACGMWTASGGGICGHSVQASTCRQTCISQGWTWDYTDCLLQYYQEAECTDINTMQCYDAFAMQTTHTGDNNGGSSNDDYPLSTLMLCSVGSGLLGLLLGALLAYALGVYIFRDRVKRESRNSLINSTFYKPEEDAEQFINPVQQQ